MDILYVLTLLVLFGMLFCVGLILGMRIAYSHPERLDQEFREHLDEGLWSAWPANNPTKYGLIWSVIAVAIILAAF